MEFLETDGEQIGLREAERRRGGKGGVDRGRRS
jgi:hypothetical protein